MNTMNARIKLSRTGIAMAAAVIAMTSCNKQEQIVQPAPPENEFLTTVILTCVSADGSDTEIATWRDLTPDDTIPPDTSEAVLNLKTNTVYHLQIGLLDETQTPPGDVGAEILDRGNYHLFCFYTTGTLSDNLTITRTDQDTNDPPLPIGLQDDLSTMDVSNGYLEVVLRHQPNEKDGSCDPGSTDLDVFFRINIID